MPAVQPRFGKGLPISYTAAEAIVGGQLVERRAGARLVGVAAAASLSVAGVAAHDDPLVRSFISGPQVGDGNELTVWRNVVILVTFLTAANPGDRLMAAAGGQVQVPPAIGAAYAQADAINTRAIVGHAFDAVAAGATGLAYIGGSW